MLNYCIRIRLSQRKYDSVLNGSDRVILKNNKIIVTQSNSTRPEYPIH
jgi:hypothetical protein